MICAIVSQSGRVVKTRCGETITFKKGQDLPSRVTGWESLVTCDDCIDIREEYHLDDD